jgi:hypothetical protein
MRLGGPQSRSGRYREIKILDPTGNRIPTPPGIEFQPLSHASRSQSLYSLRYRGWSNRSVRKLKKNASWTESASELYRPNNHRLLKKLVPTFADRGCNVVSVTDPYGRNFGIVYRSRDFFFQVAPQLYSRGWVDHREINELFICYWERNMVFRTLNFNTSTLDSLLPASYVHL